MEYVIVKVRGVDNRAELRERASDLVLAAGSLQACAAAARLFGVDFRTEGYKSCLRFGEGS